MSTAVALKPSAQSVYWITLLPWQWTHSRLQLCSKHVDCWLKPSTMSLLHSCNDFHGNEVWCYHSCLKPFMIHILANDWYLTYRNMQRRMVLMSNDEMPREWEIVIYFLALSLESHKKKRFISRHFHEKENNPRFVCWHLQCQMVPLQKEICICLGRA